LHEALNSSIRIQAEGVWEHGAGRLLTPMKKDKCS